MKYVDNRRGQQKRVNVLEINDGIARTNIGEFPESSLHDKLQMKKNVERTTDNLVTISEFSKGLYGRDNTAHHNRYLHVLKIHKGGSILDFGSGIGQLPETIYRNRGKCNPYLGIEFSEKNIKKAYDRLSLKKTGELPPWMNFIQDDLTQIKKYEGSWDIITAFEIFEHIGVDNADAFLQNIVNNSNHDTIILLSTPCYDHDIGAFEGHVIEGEVNEYTYQETYDMLSKYFDIQDKFGTFISMKDFKDKMNTCEQDMFNRLSKYYTTGELSWIFAPLFPEYSRNVLWKLKLKNKGLDEWE